MRTHGRPSYDRRSMSGGTILKGLAKARRDAAVRSRTVQWLTPAVEEHLFRSADVLSEGSVHTAEGGARRYFGSTMITFDLEQLERAWRGPFDAAARAALLDLVEGSVRVRLRAMRMACAEVASRVTDRPLGTPTVETSVRMSEDKLFLDVDLEVSVGVCSSARRTL